MNIAFRVDAGTRIGAGHVMRCLVLADAITKAGGDALFICRDHVGHLAQLIESRGHNVRLLPAARQAHDSPTASGEPDYQCWLGADWQDDAQQTLELLRTDLQHVDWLVVDHYGIDRRWQAQLRPHVDKLAVIDDLANRPHECNLLIDQNWFGPATAGRYAGLLPSGADHCLGPRYALLKPEYAQLKRWRPEHDGLVRRVLVFFGGSDPDNMTGKALSALSASAFDHLALDIVLGSNYPNSEAIETLARHRPMTVLHRQLPSLAGLMLRADLMLGAGGSTTWERMCLGLPAIVISIADNQTPFNQALHDAGYLTYLGTHEHIDRTDIAAALQSVMSDGATLRRQSAAGMALVPGDGANLIADIFLMDR